MTDVTTIMLWACLELTAITMKLKRDHPTKNTTLRWDTIRSKAIGILKDDGGCTEWREGSGRKGEVNKRGKGRRSGCYPKAALKGHPTIALKATANIDNYKERRNNW